MHALPKPVTTLSHSSSIESSLEQNLASFRSHLFTALTVLSVLLVPTMGRAKINTDKVMWIAENGIGVGHIKNVPGTLRKQQQQQPPPLFLLCRIHIHPVFHIVSRALYCLHLHLHLLLLPLPLFFSSYCTRPPPSPQASSTHGNCMLPDYLGRRRYIPWSRVGPTREESKKQKKKENEKSSSLTIEQRNQPHQRELQQRQPPSSSQHQPRKFH